MIRIAIIDPRGVVSIEIIPNTLQAMQHIVGGYIETVTRPDGLIIVCNEEGRLQNLPVNRFMPNFVGTIFIVRSEGEDFASITDNDIEELF